MSAAKADDPAAEKKKGGRGKLFIFAGAALLLLGVGGWISGAIPSLLGGGAQAEGSKHPTQAQPGARDVPSPPIFVDLPDIVTNLNSTSRRATFIKLKAKVELARAEDVTVLKNAMPRVIDLFQSYLREIRPEELRGTAGTYRLREELIGRINVAAAPARATDVLFEELLVQ